MRLLYFFCLFLIFDSVGFASSLRCSNLHRDLADRYENFKELSLSEKEGVDFRIVEQDLNHPATVIAPHGGRIEPGTSEIARMIAGNLLNLYLFEGMKPRDNFSLHLTSSHFDEPRAIQIMRKSKLGISVHGFKEDNLELIEIGGFNLEAGEMISRALQISGFPVEFPSRRFQGKTLENIVNQARSAGVQLELSSKLRQNLLQNPVRLEDFGRAIRQALDEIKIN